jgi:imidazolonepropionase-like amidohydrolase
MNIDNEIALFPRGAAKASKVREEIVPAPDGEQTLSLYALQGIGFTPSYTWFDEDMEIAAYDADGYLGMIPAGWDVSVLTKLSEAQTNEVSRYMQQQAGDLSHRMESPLIFENVDVVDVVNGKLLEGRGVITSVSEIDVGRADAIRIDGTGKTLMPGLWDMHGHFSLPDGVLNIAGGITSVRDTGSVHEKIMEMTSKFDSGEVIGPTTYRAGFMDKVGPYTSGWAAQTLDDALERVDFYAEHGYIQVKLYSSIEPEWVAPIAERARSHGMRLSGHMPAFMSAEQAVRAGYNEIQHINMVFLNFSAGDTEDTRKQLRFTLYGDEAGNLDLKSKEAQDFFDLLRENEVVIDATAAIFDTQLRHLPGEPDPTFAAVVEHLPANVARRIFVPEMEMGDMAEAWGRSAENQAAMLKALHDNGIQLVPGSDNMPAFTLHREVELYSEAGISNADVLKIATLDSARVVGVADRTGSIEVGKDSDLLLLDGNPLEDIGAVRRAVLVMKGDTVYRPDRLYESVGVKPFLDSVAF